MMTTPPKQTDKTPISSLQPFVVAVVLNWNNAEETILCVQSLLNCEYENLEIVVVDNASNDGSVTKLRKAFPKIVLIIQPFNGGYGSGNNAGIRIALKKRADFVLILNNDVVVDQDFLSPMIEVVGRNPKIGIVTCKILYKNDGGRVYYAAGKFSKWLCTGVNKPQSSSYDAQKIIDVDFVNGSLLLVRREIFEEMGLFDEQYFMYFEDLEFSRRVLQKYRLVYTPEAIVYHKSGAGTGWRLYTDLYLYYHTRNRIFVFEKESLIYRTYVLVFTFGNVIAKSIVLFADSFRSSKDTLKKLKALWQGFIDGVLGKVRQ